MLKGMGGTHGCYRDRVLCICFFLPLIGKDSLELILLGYRSPSVLVMLNKCLYINTNI